MNIDMTNDRIAQNILGFSVPLFLGSILQNLYNVVDTVIVGRFVGKEAILFQPSV
jgi:Na+-driven multidrug efflux pump